MPFRERGSGPNSTRRDGVISDQGWKRKFENPIPLPRGRQLVTLKDAGTYITKLPKVEHTMAEWQAAIGSFDPGRDARGPDNVCADRHHGGIAKEKPIRARRFTPGGICDD
jgi:hypothetical protein